MGIVWAGRCLGMILDAKYRLVAMAEALQRLVIKIDVRKLNLALIERLRIHRKSVIV